MIQPPAPPDSPLRPAPRVCRADVARSLAAAALTVLLAGGCGMVGSLVGPQSVGDPLGIDGRPVSAVLVAGGIAPQATSHAEVVETISPDLPDLDQNLYGFSIGEFRAHVGLGDAVVLTGAADPDLLPDTLTVTTVLVEAQLSDRDRAVSFSDRFSLDLTYELETCNEVSCRYLLVDDLADGDVHLVLSDRARLDTLTDILLLDGEPTPNAGSVRVAIEVDTPGEVAGLMATFVLRSDGSSIELGG